MSSYIFYTKIYDLIMCFWAVPTRRCQFRRHLLHSHKYIKISAGNNIILSKEYTVLTMPSPASGRFKVVLTSKYLKKKTIWYKSRNNEPCEALPGQLGAFAPRL